jgi:hypothetical protein
MGPRNLEGRSDLAAIHPVPLDWWDRADGSINFGDEILDSTLSCVRNSLE